MLEPDWGYSDMVNTYIVDNPLRTVIAQNPALSAKHDVSEFIFEGQCEITAQEVISTYTVRNIIVKQHNNILVGYDDLEKRLLQLPKDQAMQCAHYMFKDESEIITITLVFKDSVLFGYFYFIREREP